MESPIPRPPVLLSPPVCAVSYRPASRVPARPREAAVPRPASRPVVPFSGLFRFVPMGKSGASVSRDRVARTLSLAYPRARARRRGEIFLSCSLQSAVKYILHPEVNLDTGGVRGRERGYA